MMEDFKTETPTFFNESANRVYNRRGRKPNPTRKGGPDCLDLLVDAGQLLMDMLRMYREGKRKR